MPLLQELDTLERKVLYIGVSVCPFGRKGLTQKALDLYGEEGKSIAIKLWKEGAFYLNNYGYANLSKRGFTLYDKGVLPEKRQPTKKATTSQILDYLWKHNRQEFETWLSLNNRQESQKVENHE
jgi:hypothetical protein